MHINFGDENRITGMVLIIGVYLSFYLFFLPASYSSEFHKTIPRAGEVTGVRDLPGQGIPGTTLSVPIQINVDEPNAPNGFIVNEYVPTGWNVGSSTPTYDSFDAQTGLIKWVLFGASVMDQTITYNVDIPKNVSGNYSFSGELKYTINSVEITEIIGGDTNLNVVVVPTITTWGTIIILFLFSTLLIFSIPKKKPHRFCQL